MNRFFSLASSKIARANYLFIVCKQKSLATALVAIINSALYGEIVETRGEYRRRVDDSGESVFAGFKLDPGGPSGFERIVGPAVARGRDYRTRNDMS